MSRVASDMGIPQHVPKLFCDSRVSLLWLRTQYIMQRPSTLECDTITFTKCLANGCIGLEKVVSRENVIDALTKALPQDALGHCRHLMGIT